MDDTKFNLYDVVFVTANNPSGSNEITYGNIGVIDDLFVDQDGTKSYKVKTDWSCGYWYDGSDIRKATDKEIKNKLCDLFGLKLKGEERKSTTHD